MGGHGRARRKRGANLLAGRFSIKRRLGVGSFGIVYEALDTELQAAVAIKRLNRLDPESVSRFKMEFRALADVVHPNLISLHELFTDNGNWFFTMDLVQGVDFVRYCRCTVAKHEACSTELLRPVFGQLVRAVHACHLAGYVHRDIKPANALVDAAGRLTLLDFGLVTAATESGVQARLRNSLSGTPAYMAPELFAGHAASHASDWYAVGVMLYEALFGRPPFHGNPFFRRNTSGLLDSLASLPQDLRQLCAGLLESDPRARPSYRNITTGCDLGELAADSVVPPGFLGRDQTLRELRGGLEALLAGQAALLRVQGPSGIGKTTLVQALLHDTQLDPAVVVLEGRCGEHEFVPYKAFDAVLEELVDHLMEEDWSAALDPALLAPLVHVFPSFGRLPALEGMQVDFDGETTTDLRERAFAGLRSLLAVVAKRHRLVLFIDDMHWVDRDSVALLRYVFLPSFDAPLLLIASHRDDCPDSTGILETLTAIAALPCIRAATIQVGPLSLEDARTLARAVSPGSDDSRIEAICEESAGHPYLLLELARAPSAHAAGAMDSSLNALLMDRIGLLPEGARRHLELISVAGHALEVQLLRASASATEGSDPLGVLRRARLVTSQTVGMGRRVDVYHDRVRQAVLQALLPEHREALHRWLAEALERSDLRDPERLMTHWRECGEHDRAATYAELAGDRSLRALAFDRAAGLYREAMALASRAGVAGEVGGASSSLAAPRLMRKLADALLYGGHGAACARAYVEASKGASPAERVDSMRLAAEQFLRSGHLEEGLRVLRDVLDAVELKVPATNAAILLSLLAERALLRLRGVRFRERPAEALAPAALARIDVCWSARTGVSLVDYPLHVAFQSLHVRLALDAGEPFRVGRALIAEGALMGGSGSPMTRRADDLLERGRALAERLQDPYLIASYWMSKGANEYFLGRWRSAMEHLERGEVIFRDRCRGVAWEVSSTHLFWLSALRYRGSLDEVQRGLDARLKRAEQLGDLYASVSMSLHLGTLALLANDDPAGAGRNLEVTRNRWPNDKFRVQQWLALSAEIDLSLYQGEADRALRLIEEQRRAFEGSFIDRVQLVRVEWHYRCAVVALSVEKGQRAPLLRMAQRSLRQLHRENLPWSHALAAVIDAGLAARQGRTSVVVDRLQDAARRFDELDMALHAASVRYEIGKLTAGSGAQAKNAGDIEMMALGARNPERWARIYVPRVDQGPRPGAFREDVSRRESPIRLSAIEIRPLAQRG